MQKQAQQLHPLQMQILRELLFHPDATFTDLNISKISTDQFSYHLRIMQKAGLVRKEGKAYILTNAGKEYANRMETDSMTVEKQPKVSVLIIPEMYVRKQPHYLIQVRLKEPYYGYKGFMTGKIRFGETVAEAAARELMEESSLEAEFKHLFTLHEMVYSKQGEMLEDKFFNIVKAFDVNGECKDSESGKNQWVTEAKFLTMSPKYHNEEEIYFWFKKGNKLFKEKKYYIERF